MDEEDLRKKEEFEDYNRELAGVSGSRMTRFFDDGSPQGRKENQRRERQRDLQSQLDILMANPVYAAAYESANNAINSAQSILNEAAAKAAARIEHLTDLLEEMEAQTAKLPDGTAVFMDKNGVPVTADGRHLSKDETSLLINPDSILSYDVYSNARDALNGARAKQDKYGEIQSDIDNAHKRMDGTPDLDTVQDVEKDMEAAIEEIEATQNVTQIFGYAADPADSNPLNDPEFKIDAIAP